MIGFGGSVARNSENSERSTEAGGPTAVDTPKPLRALVKRPLKGVADVPGDKSVSHRALILGALTVGETRIQGLLEGEDVLDTAKAMRAFGADVIREGPGSWSVHGVGVGGFREPENVIDCGNSGTGVRLIMGAMATCNITATFVGDASLSGRPMRRVTEPLGLFGAVAQGRRGDYLPIMLRGAATPVPVLYTTQVPSAQVKSAMLLAGLNAPGETSITERVATRDHTERMLAGFGAEISTETTEEGHLIRLRGHPELQPQSVEVPRDPSSAAFPVAAALLVEGSEVHVLGVSRNPTRDGLYRTLQDMGADIVFTNDRDEGGEPVADLTVQSSRLRGVTVPAERAASMIDEYPILSVLAAFADGTTKMEGVRELRFKESDRIDAMARGLEACGIEVAETEDTFTVHGRGPDNVRGGAEVATRLDHRIAMSFLCLSLGSQKPVTIDDARPISTSFPTFMDLMRALGADFRS
ncbi:MAG: 3-phosphoshikimate 1-carboxyvinyltransferase [Pseudomonadota bacterium]